MFEQDGLPRAGWSRSHRRTHLAAMSIGTQWLRTEYLALSYFTPIFLLGYGDNSNRYRDPVALIDKGANGACEV